MRWLGAIALAVCVSAGAAAQNQPTPSAAVSNRLAPGDDTPPPAVPGVAVKAELPDAPSQVQAAATQAQAAADHQPPGPQQSVVVVSKAAFSSSGIALRPCSIMHHKKRTDWDFEDPTMEQARKLCIDKTNPYDRFLNTTMRIPMTPNQKAYLAFRNLTDPFNLATIVATSAFTIGTDSHTAFGPGWSAVGRLTGITYVQDATGEFFGTWLVPSIAREDPHYHRLPEASIPRRTLHAISRTVIAQHDDGSPMPNYSTLLIYPITAEIANLYVPGVQTNAPSTTARILTGYATDPIANLITEFLPDVAKRVHVRIIFVQRILNQVATGQPGTE